MLDLNSNLTDANKIGFNKNASAKSLLDILFENSVINSDQLNQIKLEIAQTGDTEENIVLKSGLVTEANLGMAKAILLGVPYTSLSQVAFSPQALSFISRIVAQRFNLIPISYDDKTKILGVAMSNPENLEAIQFIRQKAGLEIKVFVASAQEIKNAIATEYRQELVGEVGKAVKETEELKSNIKVIDSKKIGEIIKEAPIAKIVSTILEYAIHNRASDIHIEPMQDRIRVRYRIDGILYERLTLPKEVQESVISRIKVLSEMKIDEHRIPQDGRFDFKSEEKEVDLRISVLPIADGEKVVMRLLQKSGGLPSLQELGLNGVALRNLETAILRPHGIIIVCGPTGSGKTTTLYSILSRLNTTKVNILSLEDPVEYEIQGINQVQINPGVGLTFASGLRSFLRQDPNIILVGEIRDKETTDLAIQAALTGHLVFSTLHTSSAAGALPRLIDLGAENFLLSSTMSALVGQRIVRKICEACKLSFKPADETMEEIKIILGNLYPKDESKITFFKAQGCSKCGNNGYLGRVGIFEVLTINEKIANLILTRPDSDTIEKQAIENGMITMKQDGYLKVLQGVTTIEEVLRVAQE